jgi:hypothetical protein
MALSKELGIKAAMRSRTRLSTASTERHRSYWRPTTKVVNCLAFSRERTNHMRLGAFTFAIILTCPAAAAEWKEFQSPDHLFTVNFPSDPKIETTAYHTPDGRSFNAQIYSTAQETGVFTLTVAEVPETGNQVQEDALMSDAVKKVTEGALIKFDIQHRIRWFYGRQLGLAGVNGGYSYVAVFHHNNRLYQIEGKAFVAGGQAEVDAMRFQQSLDFQ